MATREGNPVTQIRHKLDNLLPTNLFDIFIAIRAVNKLQANTLKSAQVRHSAINTIGALVDEALELLGEGYWYSPDPLPEKQDSELPY